MNPRGLGRLEGTRRQRIRRMECLSSAEIGARPKFSADVY